MENISGEGVYSGVKSKSQPGNMLIICLKFSKFQPVYALKVMLIKKKSVLHTVTIIGPSRPSLEIAHDKLYLKKY